MTTIQNRLANCLAGLSEPLGGPHRPDNPQPHLFQLCAPAPRPSHQTQLYLLTSVTLVELYPLPAALLSLPAATFQGQTGASLARPRYQRPRDADRSAVWWTLRACGPAPEPLDLLHKALSRILHHAHTRGLTSAHVGTRTTKTAPCEQGNERFCRLRFQGFLSFLFF